MTLKFDKDGNLLVLKDLRKQKESTREVYSKDNSVTISRTQISKLTPKMCHIKLKPTHVENLEIIEKLFRQSTFCYNTSYSRKISFENKENSILVKIPGYGSRCSFCNAFVDHLRRNLKVLVIEDEYCPTLIRRRKMFQSVT